MFDKLALALICIFMYSSYAVNITSWLRYLCVLAFLQRLKKFLDLYAVQ